MNLEAALARIRQTRALRPVGYVQSNDGVITARLQAAVGDTCLIRPERSAPLLAEVIGFRDRDCFLLPLEDATGVAAGDDVHARGGQTVFPCGPQLLGRVLDGLARPLDGAGPIPHDRTAPLQFQAPSPLGRAPIREPLATGQRAIDGFLTIGRGQRVGLFAGSGLGKSTLLGEITKYAECDCAVVALIGERGREVRPFIEQALGAQGLRRSVVLVATSDQSPLLRIRAARAAVAIASDFRNQGKHVLLVLDSITRLAAAQREIGILLREPPTARGYTPSVFRLLTAILEQLGTNEHGSITGIVTVLVDGDDTEEPISDAVRSIVDGHIILERELAERGHFPAIRISRSLSRVFDQICSAEHRAAAEALRQAMVVYDDFADLIRLGIYQPGTTPQIDRAIKLMPELERFLCHPPGEVTSFQETQRQLRQLAHSWVQ